MLRKINLIRAFVVTVFFASIAIYFYYQPLQFFYYDSSPQIVTLDVLELRMSVDDQPPQHQEMPTCLFPKLDLDWSFLPHRFEGFNCQKRHSSDLIRVQVHNGRYLQFAFANVTDLLPHVNCSWQELTLVDDYNLTAAKFEIFEHLNIKTTTTPLNPIFTPCPAQVFQLYCFDLRTGKRLYQNTHRCIVTKNQEIQHSKSDDDRLNFFLVGIDSLSRQGWLEQFKRATKFLKQNSDADTVFLEGYNIVGDGSTQNFLALMTGRNQKELPEARKNNPNASQVDEFPFLWKFLKNQAGYVTLWDEDQPQVGAIHYRLKGFKNPPQSLDFYGRTFQLALKHHADHCQGELSDFEEQIRLYRHVAASFPDPVPKFVSTFNTPFTHVAAREQRGYLLDGELALELKWLQDESFLNRTVVILHSDHGPRYGPERASFQGKVHERLPYASLTLPSWYGLKYPERLAALKANSKLLTSAMDLHATILNLAGLKVADLGLPHGKSLLEPLPLDRTCHDAGIAPHWCACLDTENGLKLELDDVKVTTALKAFEEHVNQNLIHEQISKGLCVAVRADRPFAARQFGLNRQASTIRGALIEQVFHVQVSFWTQPGDGQWEVTFQTTPNDTRVLSDQISRTNRYGSAAQCIADTFPDLREYCFCKQQHQPDVIADNDSKLQTAKVD